MDCCSYKTSSQQSYIKTGFSFFLLLHLVWSLTLALFGTLEPQFVHVRLTDGQVGKVGQVGHTAERQDSC